MPDEGILYLAHAGQIRFKQSSPPVAVVGLFVPNRLNKSLTNSIIDIRARVTESPFGPTDWVRVCKYLPVKPPEPSNEPRSSNARESDIAYHLVSQLLQTLSKQTGVRLFACAAWPHQLLMKFRNFQKQANNAERESLVWLNAAHMVLQRSHMCFNDNSIFASVLVSQANPELNPANFELLTAQGFDRFITYRMFVETLCATEPQWSALFQCTQMIAEIVAAALQRNFAAKGILQLCDSLWHRSPQKQLAQFGFVTLPGDPDLIGWLKNIGIA